jgi:hypothetical protein
MTWASLAERIGASAGRMRVSSSVAPRSRGTPNAPSSAGRRYRRDLLEQMAQQVDTPTLYAAGQRSAIIWYRLFGACRILGIIAGDRL